ncbi:MAG: hypothetical protein CMC08_08560 [Flavobacteriaceae bacterium]|nr:hypothetical protein [Flavobacteriaceae bacterium]
MLLSLFQDFPNDGGPIYAETVAGRFPVEPYNTYSNFLFLFIIIYFSWRVYKNYRQHLFLAYSLPVLFIGWIGGTIYHATRSADVWLYLDWLPIVILCFAVSVYFIFKIAHQWWQNVLILVGVLLIVIGGRLLPWAPSLRISIGYVLTAIGLLLPLLVYTYKTQFRNIQLVLYAVLSFAVAVAFRTLDSEIEFLSVGTHWLWHTFGAIAVFFLMRYIYFDKIKA